jgi:hypothetical protein
VIRPVRWIDRLLHKQQPVVLVKKFPKGPMFLFVQGRRGRTEIKRNWI